MARRTKRQTRLKWILDNITLLPDRVLDGLYRFMDKDTRISNAEDGFNIESFGADLDTFDNEQMKTFYDLTKRSLNEYKKSLVIIDTLVKL